ncbi:hypothetical protein MTO96_010860 [Rhipicephalus appendiculatus]
MDLPLETIDDIVATTKRFFLTFGRIRRSARCLYRLETTDKVSQPHRLSVESPHLLPSATHCFRRVLAKLVPSIHQVNGARCRRDCAGGRPRTTSSTSFLGKPASLWSAHALKPPKKVPLN